MGFSHFFPQRRKTERTSARNPRESQLNDLVQSNDAGEVMPVVAPEIATFRMTVADSYDAALRVLTDAQRFGLDLLSLELRPSGEAQELIVTLTSAAVVDRQLLAHRFARHPTVLRVDEDANAFAAEAA
jgi:hypothetical protein